MRTSRALVLRLSITALGAAAALWFSPSCGGKSASDRCQVVCDCVGCNATERAACEAQFADNEKLAGDKGCTDAYDAYLSCFDTHGTCVGSKMDLDACATESTALTGCSGGGSTLPGADPCTTLKQEELTCCNTIAADASVRDQCVSAVNKVFASTGITVQACQTALAQFHCPTGGTGGSGGTGGWGGSGGSYWGGSGGTGGTVGGCYDCACSLETYNGGCADICDNTMSGSSTPNFCNGVTALSQCEACIQSYCGSSSANCY